MKLLSEFDAVIFDLDGVITDTARYHYLGWKKLADELEVPFTEHENEQLKGVDRMSSLQYILDLGGLSLAEEQKQKLADKKNRYYQNYIRDITEDDILPGVVKTLEALKACNKKIALASASRNASSIINNLQLQNYFEYIADASLARSKPAPDIFLFAAYGLGVPAANCAGIEDSIAGLQSIKASSMYAVGVGADDLGKYADVVISDMQACAVS